MLLPQSVIPSISGPVLGTNNFGSAWGSAIGGLVSWEPFDFGLRQANVSAAESARAQSEATLKRTAFEIATATADSYLTLAAAQQTVRAAQAGVDRAETLLKTTNAVVNAQLRPGADSSRAEAELAAARTQLIQARQAVEVARATLAQFVSEDPAQIAVIFRWASALASGCPAPRRSEFQRESLHRRAERHRGTGQSPTPRIGTVLFPEVLPCKVPLTRAAPAMKSMAVDWEA